MDFVTTVVMSLDNSEEKRMDPEQGGSEGDGQSQESRYSKEEVSKMISERVNALTGELNQLKTQLKEKPPEHEKTYTRAELNAAVKNRTISEAEAQNIFDAQQKTQTERTAQQVAKQTFESISFEKETQSAIDKYKQADPDLVIPGTDSRTRIEQEVQEQMRILGVKQPTLGIELAALRAVYGPESGLDGKAHNRQSHSEVGGADGEPAKDDSPQDLSAKEKAYYQRRIDDGLYKGWDEVKKELEFANPSVRKRAAARG